MQGRVSGPNSEDEENCQMKAEEDVPARQNGPPAERKQVPDPLMPMLGAQQHQAEAADDDEQAQFKVLPTAEKVVPYPEVLGDGHGEQLHKDESQQEAAEAGANLRPVRQVEPPRPYENPSRDRHALRFIDSTLRRRVSPGCERNT